MGRRPSLPAVTSEETPAAALGPLMQHNAERQKKWGNSCRYFDLTNISEQGEIVVADWIRKTF
jgi:hypothetical protein